MQSMFSLLWPHSTSSTCLKSTSSLPHLQTQTSAQALAAETDRETETKTSPSTQPAPEPESACAPSLGAREPPLPPPASAQADSLSERTAEPVSEAEPVPEPSALMPAVSGDIRACPDAPPPPQPTSPDPLPSTSPSAAAQEGSLRAQDAPGEESPSLGEGIMAGLVVQEFGSAPACGPACGPSATGAAEQSLSSASAAAAPVTQPSPVPVRERQRSLSDKQSGLLKGEPNVLLRILCYECTPGLPNSANDARILRVRLSRITRV